MVVDTTVGVATQLLFVLAGVALLLTPFERTGRAYHRCGRHHRDSPLGGSDGCIRVCTATRFVRGPREIRAPSLARKIVCHDRQRFDD